MDNGITIVKVEGDTPNQTLTDQPSPAVPTRPQSRSDRPPSRPPSRSDRPPSRPPSRSDRPSSRPSSRSDRPSSRPPSSIDRRLSRQSSLGEDQQTLSRTSSDAELGDNTFRRNNYGSIRFSTDGVTRIKIGEGNEDGEDVGDAVDDVDSKESAAHQQGTEDLMKVDATSEGTEDLMKVDATSEGTEDLMKVDAASEGPRDLMDNTEELQEHEGTVDVSEGTADAKVAAENSSDMVIPNGMVGAPAPSYSSLENTVQNPKSENLADHKDTEIEKTIEETSDNPSSVNDNNVPDEIEANDEETNENHSSPANEIDNLNLEATAAEDLTTDKVAKPEQNKLNEAIFYDHIVFDENTKENSAEGGDDKKSSNHQQKLASKVNKRLVDEDVIYRADGDSFQGTLINRRHKELESEEPGWTNSRETIIPTSQGYEQLPCYQGGSAQLPSYQADGSTVSYQGVGSALILPEGEGPIVLEIDSKRNSFSSQHNTQIPDEPLKTLLSLVFLLFGFIFTSVSLSVTHEYMPEYPPLPDLFLDNTNYLEWGLDASEYIIIGLVTVAFIIVISHKHRMVVLRRLFLMIGMLYVYRGVTMFITVLPKPDTTYYCSPKLNHTITFLEVMSRSLRIISGGGLTLNGNQVYCGDFIFSGHTMALLMAFFVIREYTPRRFWYLHWVALAVAVTGMVFLLLGRGHYSIDVLIAYWVTSRIWWVYHTLAHNENLKTDGRHNFISNIWWWHVFRYFEREIQGPLPAVYSVPLPTSLVSWFSSPARRSGYTRIDAEV